MFRVEFQARWSRFPADPMARVLLALGHNDDGYSEPGLVKGSGYEAFLRADGGLASARTSTAPPADVVLTGARTPALAERQRVTLRLTVTATTITWARTDVEAEVVMTRDLRSRGPHLHIGRQSPPPSQVAFRALTVR